MLCCMCPPYQGCSAARCSAACTHLVSYAVLHARGALLHVPTLSGMLCCMCLVALSQCISCLSSTSMVSVLAAAASAHMTACRRMPLSTSGCQLLPAPAPAGANFFRACTHGARCGIRVRARALPKPSTRPARCCAWRTRWMCDARLQPGGACAPLCRHDSGVHSTQWRARALRLGARASWLCACLCICSGPAAVHQELWGRQSRTSQRGGSLGLYILRGTPYSAAEAGLRVRMLQEAPRS